MLATFTTIRLCPRCARQLVLVRTVHPAGRAGRYVVVCHGWDGCGWSSEIAPASATTPTTTDA